MRSLEEIQNEYNSTCAHAGSIAYKLLILEEDYQKRWEELQTELKQKQARLKELSLEGYEAKAAQAKTEGETNETSH
jgi:hypothetical protein